MNKTIENFKTTLILFLLLANAVFAFALFGIPSTYGSDFSRVIPRSFTVAQILQGNFSEPLVTISGVAQNPAKIKGGEFFTVTFNLSNVGNEDALMVLFSLSVSYPFAIVNSSSNFSVGNLLPTEYRLISVGFSVDQNGVVGVYSISFTIQYKDLDGTSYTQSGTFGTQISGNPEIQIESMRLDPSSLSPGQEGLMTIRLTNVGTDVATDIVIKIFGGKDIIASSMTSIAKIEGKKSESAIFPVNVDSKLEPATYLLNITATYRGNSNTIYHSSRLFEFKVAAIAPFVPPFYIAIVAGAALVALVGYFLYAWNPKNPPEGNSPQPNPEKIQKSNMEHERHGGESQVKRKLPLKKVLIIPYITALFILLLAPYLVHVNLENAGFVVYSEEMSLESLPEGVQEIAKLRGFIEPVVLLVKHQQPEWVTMVITSERFSTGEIVEMSDYVVNWRVDWLDFNLAGQTFERFAIAKVERLNSVESAIETLLMPPFGETLYVISKVDFYAGPILIILSLTVLVQRRLALWNLPAILCLYSLQVWSQTKIAYEHNLYVTPEWNTFGYLFTGLLPLTLYIWHFERSEGGHDIAQKLNALSQAIGLSN